MSDWNRGKPPPDELVEVRDGARVIRVRARWGRDGMRPHWESQDGNTLWPPEAFREWRKIND